MVETVVESYSGSRTAKGKRINCLDILNSEAKRFRNRKNPTKDVAFRMRKARTMRAIIKMKGE